MSFDLNDLDTKTKQVYIDRHYPTDYKTFVTRVQSDVKEAIETIEENANHHKDSGEDLLTSQIVSYLKACKYSATQDENYRGHVDIKVKLDQYIWLAEAKKWKSYAWLLKGTAQLINRYSTGRPNQNYGALIIYYSCTDVQGKLKNWKSFLESSTQNGKHQNIRDRLGVTSTRCKIDEELFFYSTHAHENSGQQYNVWHVPVLLHFNPSDVDI